VIGRSARLFRLRTLEPQRLEVELIDEDVHHPDWVVLGDVVVQALREQRALGPVLAFDVSLPGALASLRQSYVIRLILQCVFTHPRPGAALKEWQLSGALPEDFW